jgi:hypothetical protein
MVYACYFSRSFHVHCTVAKERPTGRFRVWSSGVPAFAEVVGIYLLI